MGSTGEELRERAAGILSSSEEEECREEAGEEERGDISRGSKRLYEKVVPEPLGVIVPPFECSVGRIVGKSWKMAPCRRDFLPLKVNVVVVGVAGGEEGPACCAKLKLGVVGRMSAMLLSVCACEWHKCSKAECVKASMPAVGISNKEKEDEED
jgi:hypothetical protein